MSGQLSPPGAVANDADMRGISEWVLADGVVVLCPEGLRQFARGAERLMDERDAYADALRRIADENYLRGSHDDGCQGMCARQGRLAREALAVDRSTP